MPFKQKKVTGLCNWLDELYNTWIEQYVTP